MSATKCSSKNPATCRYHGHAQIATIKEQLRTAEANQDFEAFYHATKALEALNNTEDGDKQNFTSQTTSGPPPMPLFPASTPSPKLKWGSNHEWYWSSSDPRVSAGTSTPDYVHTLDSWNDPVAYARADLNEYKSYPKDVRVQASHPLSDEQIRQVREIANNLYREIFASNGFEAVVDRDGESSVILTIDSIEQTFGKQDRYVEFNKRLNETLQKGTRVRKTNDDGPGTIGTRRHRGLGTNTDFTLYLRTDEIVFS